MAADQTPLMRQYHALKQQVPGTLLFFRLGDFYELFFEDAVTAARELEITLTSRSKEKDIPMCGVPYHAAEGYLARLIQKGYRVAVCEQTEDPKATKGLVKREVTRVVTPGTATNPQLLTSNENIYLAALLPGKPPKDDRSFGERHPAGVAFVDLSTGEFRATEMDLAEARATLETWNAREVVIPNGQTIPELPCLATEVDAWVFESDYATRSLMDHFHLLALDGCGLEGKPLATGAASAILHYLKETQRSALEHLERPAFFNRAEAMVLDGTTVRNLELVDTLFANETKDSTLISVLGRTRTGMGGRLLRRRMLAPAIDRAEIEARLDAIAELHGATILRAGTGKDLEAILDLERLLSKVSLASAGPRDLTSLARSLAVSAAVRQRIAGVGSARLVEIRERIDEVAEVRDGVLTALVDEPPVNLNDGGAVRPGFDAALDELRDISQNSKTFLAQIEQRERERTGISSLKVRFNNVFGYYIEVSKANRHLVPEDYDRKQTLVNAERFITPELKVLEQKILEAEDKMQVIERRIFEELRTLIASHAARIKETAAAIAELDLSVALTEVAVDGRYVRPTFSDSGAMHVVAGRHPVIERLTERDAQRYIPNDVYFDPEKEFIALITGPNMGGKSTYLRQTALLVILAQLGSFVPAEKATLPIVDRVFTRIGAADNLARGRSTFMVEMTETAVILNSATKNSLVILDEIGRGTATYDGLALAWAVIEHIHSAIGAKTLFATHYHELTALADQLAGVRNLHVSVKESGDQILFLRRVEPGAADKSYGIEVARLAALPMAVIERARQILALHESAETTVAEELAPHPSAGSLQIQLFEPVNGGIAEKIRALKLDELRPLDALQILAELQQELGGASHGPTQPTPSDNSRSTSPSISPSNASGKATTQ